MLNLRNSYSEPDNEFDAEFKLDDEYVSSLPDLQNGEIKGANVYIPHVGIHNFRVPVKIKTKDGKYLTLETSVTGTVSLYSGKKGINMSRIIRGFYEHDDRILTLKEAGEVLADICKKSNAPSAEMLLRFSYPIRVPALRTEGLSGYQYYDVVFGIRYEEERVQYQIDFDFVYSSACPCSYELAEHARKFRNKATVSHSQRSVARIQLLLSDKHPHIWIEDIQELCVAALNTETQVMVKRADEQAFAELNGSYTKFVEDAARLLYQQFYRSDISDFRIVLSHLESLHSHDAVAVITKYSNHQGYFRPTLDYHEFRSLVR